MSWKNLFVSTPHVEAYLKYRPTYPVEFYDRIMLYLEQQLPPPHQQAVDVGCGSGQNTRPLAQYFHEVLGTDISDGQIEQGRTVKEPGNVGYRVGNFDDICLPNESVELVTTSTAAHWFHPIEDFYREADRVLKRNGVLAVYGYDRPTVSVEGLDTDELTQAYMELYRDDRIKKCQTGRALLLDDHYRSFQLPYPGWERVDDMTIDRTTSLMDFINYVGTWYFFVKYVENYPDEPDPLVQLAERYQEIIGSSRTLAETKCHVSHEIFLLIGRKP